MKDLLTFLNYLENSCDMSVSVFNML